MLIIRYLVAIVIALVLCDGIALSNDARDNEAISKKHAKAKDEEKTTKIDTTSLEKTIRDSVKEATEKPDIS